MATSQRLCRLCLIDLSSRAYTKNIFKWPKKGPTYADTILGLMNIQMEPKPTWPSNACRDCILSIKNLLEFKEKIETTQETLSQDITDEILPMDDTLLEVAIKEESDDKNNLRQKLEATSAGSSIQDDCKESNELESETNSQSNDVLDMKSEDEISMRDEQSPETDPECEEKQEDIPPTEDIPERPIRRRRLRVSAQIDEELPPETEAEEDEWEPQVKYKPKMIGDGKRATVKVKKEGITRRRRTGLSKASTEMEGKLKALNLLYCTECGDSHESFDELCSHLTNMHDLKKHDIRVVCCNTQFNRYSVYDHALYHDDNDTFKCVDCGKQCMSEYARKRHINKVHLPDSEKKFRCKTCGKGFQERDRLARHEESHEPQEFKCKSCGLEFLNKKELRNHINLEHENATQHICEICGKGFKTNMTLKSHSYWHTNKRTVEQCDECGLYFINVNEHKSRTHRKNFTQPCPECGKVLDAKYLKLHIKSVHRLEKNYPCTICEKSFITKAKLTAHLDIHMGARHKCHFCDETYGCVTNRLKHMQKKHAEQYAEYKQNRNLEKKDKYKILTKKVADGTEEAEIKTE